LLSAMSERVNVRRTREKKFSERVNESKTAGEDIFSRVIFSTHRCCTVSLAFQNTS
jgi:hypothetical protein